MTPQARAAIGSFSAAAPVLPSFASLRSLLPMLAAKPCCHLTGQVTAPPKPCIERLIRPDHVRACRTTNPIHVVAAIWFLHDGDGVARMLWEASEKVIRLNIIRACDEVEANAG